MKRFFGSSKPRERATLDGTITMVDKQGDHLETRIAKLNGELQTLNNQMKNATTQTAKNVIKTKALRLLKQRKQYENQLGQLRQQSFNMDNMNYAVHSMQNAVVMTEAIQISTKAIKQNMRKVDIDKVEILTDNMQDLMEEANEISNILGDSYGQEMYDEDELMAEFEDLDVMCADEDKTGRLLDDIGISQDLNNIVISSTAKIDNSTIPSNNYSSRQPVLLSSEQSKKTSANIKVDEFGLPLE